MDNRNKKEKKPTVKKEENAVVLDYLSRGYVSPNSVVNLLLKLLVQNNSLFLN